MTLRATAYASLNNLPCNSAGTMIEVATSRSPKHIEMQLNSCTFQPGNYRLSALGRRFISW
jgi:hypothetical protein